MPKNIKPTEARRRIDELRTAALLAHEYARTLRATELTDGTPESDADHALHVGMLSVAYATKYLPHLDPYKVAFYALFHDIDEAVVQDTNTLGATAEQLAAKNRREAEGRKVIRRRLAAFPEFLRLLDSLEDLSVPEFAFVKGVDKWAPGFVHRENKGSDLKKRGITSHQDIVEACAVTDAKMKIYTKLMPEVMAVRTEMHRLVAEEVFGI